ncbi:hypothetical protein ACQPZQ_42995 [Pseudonocardia sp. CA-142604]
MVRVRRSGLLLEAVVRRVGVEPLTADELEQTGRTGTLSWFYVRDAT